MLSQGLRLCFFTANDRDKALAATLARHLHERGFEIIATRGTANAIRAAGVPAKTVFKVNDPVRAGGAQTWREMHAWRDGESQWNLLRRCTYAGRPFGKEAFVARLEEHFQRSWRRWSFENALAAGNRA